MQTVCAGILLCAFDGDICGEGNRCVLVCASAPDFVVWNGVSPEFAAANQGRVVVDGDVGEADALGDYRVLTKRWKNEFRSLATVLELSLGTPRQKKECSHKSKVNSR